MKKIFLIAVSCCVFFVGCSKEESKPLPPLEKVALPESVIGMYSGKLPCDNCKARMVRLVLAEDSSVTAVQTVVTDSMKTDTLRGSFSMNGDVLTLSLSEGSVNMKFKRDSLGNMALLTGAGTVYEDADGMKFDMIRILVPMKKPAQPATDSAEGK
ncbi:copper resistance protein NlpE N-terminal domain-containing protein [Fibrobacter sp. UBA4309]|uniref:copper resistance protein NlpE N-terminal domain-containing protein n=1 Tax=Fibrobacter sp. UBA4309 TaxID=1946537 RepID=UPI0025BF2B45|nr:copper resistance protein NlpE N-terminal domain-containing protein [Fibrobacter sp. UBA4309]